MDIYLLIKMKKFIRGTILPSEVNRKSEQKY
jgi:hypothetical protein